MKASQLWCAVGCDPSLQSRVIGVFAKDTLPTLTPSLRAKGVGLIVNTENSTREGRHWIAMYVRRNEAVLFDSLAEPVHDVFDRYLKSYARSYQRNIQPLQSADSSECGFYCLYFLLRTFRDHLTLNQIVHLFDKRDLLWNDVFVANYICHYFKYCTDSCRLCIV